MRCVGGLLALAGCNQIFSLAPTREFDAAVDVIPDMPHVELTYQLASVLPSGDPNRDLTYPPIAPAPQIRLATLDGAFEPAAYSPTDGWILIPRSYLGTTWRLEYTLPNDIPHEIQWNPEDELGHLTIALAGRLAAAAVPSDSGYTITPTGASPYTFPRVLTTGLWTDGAATARPPPNDTTADYAFDSAIPLSGGKGRPDPTRGDRAYLVDYIPDSNCRVANGSVRLDSAELTGGSHTVQTPNSVWDASRKLVTASAVDLTSLMRLATVLDKLHTTVGGNLLFGIVPSLNLPGLLGTTPLFTLPTPIMQTLLRCPYTTLPALPATALPATAGPGGLGFPYVLHVQLVDTRLVAGVSLTSGMATVIASSEVMSSQVSFPAVSFPAAMATHMTLTTAANGVLDLSGDDEQLATGPTTGPFTLDFTPESATGLRADYHDVLLHKLVGTRLTTERVYTIVAPRLRIEGATLAPATLYVLEIRSYKGHPSAAHGDFAPVDYPYGAGIVFTRTFKTP
jgi:hypothetical protein